MMELLNHFYRRSQRSRRLGNLKFSAVSATSCRSWMVFQSFLKAYPFDPSGVWRKMKQTLRRAAVVLVAALLVGMLSSVGAADYAGYTALDQSQPVSFDGKTVKWNHDVTMDKEK